MTTPPTLSTIDDGARLAALLQASQSLGASPDLDDTLLIALDAAIRLTESQRGFLMLFDDDGHLVLRLARGAAGENLDEHAIHSSRTAVDAVARSGAPLVTTSEPSAPAPAHTTLAVPLMVRGHISGVLCVETNAADQHGSQPTLDLLNTFGAQAAFAIDNARLRQAVQDANTARSDFVRTVTHELRIPLTSIKGYTDLLKLVGSLTTQQEEFVAVIHNNIERMTVLVSDLSDIARIDSGRLRLDLRPVDLYDLLRESLLNLRNQIESKQQILHIELPPDLPRIRADKHRLAQVLGNLLNNAHKYAPPGSTITLAAQPEAGHVRISVIDNGYGISPADQARIFEQFFRSDEPAIREQVGWGLGLHLTRRLVELQSGQISVHTALGQGSTFSVTLPAATD